MPGSHAAVVLLAMSFVAFAVVLPLVRLWWRSGTFGLVVHRTVDPVGRFVSRAFGIGVFGVLAWAIAVVTTEPQALGLLSVPGWATSMGLALGGLGLLLVVVAQADMGGSWRIGVDDRPTALIATGLYRWIRHPIYTGLLLLLIAVVLLTPSAWTFAGGVWLATMIALQSRVEEVHLERIHGTQWRSWAARTGRFVPGIGRVPP